MREASNGRTVTDTDSYAFIVLPIISPTRGRPRRRHDILARIWSYTNISDKEIDCLQRKQMSGWRLFYRGQSDASRPIVTTLSRCIGGANAIETLWNCYLTYYSEFKEYASKFNFCEYKPNTENPDLFYLSIARHLGFPCHLIDWTARLETALHFASLNRPDYDGAIWVLGCREHLNDKPISQSPFDFDKPKLICKEYDFTPSNAGLINMPLGRLRRFRQNGFFSIIPKSFLLERFESLLDENYFIKKLVVSPASKTAINTEISPYVKSRLYGEDKNSFDEKSLLGLVDAISRKLKLNTNL